MPVAMHYVMSNKCLDVTYLTKFQIYIYIYIYIYIPYLGKHNDIQSFDEKLNLSVTKLWLKDHRYL